VSTAAQIITDLLYKHCEQMQQGRWSLVAKAIVDSGELISREDHRAQERSWADHQRRNFDAQQAAERALSTARRELGLCDPERIKAALTLLRGANRQRTAKHDDLCWRRHTGCLADKIANTLTGNEGR
jgi:hypothetical protein